MPPARGRYLSASAFVASSPSILLTAFSIFLLISVILSFELSIESSTLSLTSLITSSTVFLYLSHHTEAASATIPSVDTFTSLPYICISSFVLFIINHF
nr:MAG TPA: hypothetical protein [Caudoviricetes sp.]